MARSAVLAVVVMLGCAGPSLRGGGALSGVAPTTDTQASSRDSSQQSSQQSTDQTTQNTRASTANSTQQTTDNVTQGTRDSAAQVSANASLAIVSVVGIGATAVGIGLLIWALQPPPAAASATAHAYLRANARQLREDLAVGAGPVIEDLASAARIRPENLDRFGTLLRMHRAELLALADPQRLDDERAAATLRRIGEIARTDDALAADGARLAAEALAAP